MPKCLPMKRSHILAFFMATALAMPAAAQQLSEQEARNAVQSTIDVWVNAAQKKDAAAIAALYTEKSMRVTPDGILYGRAAIEKNLEEGLKVFSGISLKLDQVHVLGNGAIEATGTWAGTLQTPNGPVSVNGFWGVTERAGWQYMEGRPGRFVQAAGNGKGGVVSLFMANRALV